MKRQIQFSRKNKFISKYRLLKDLPRLLSVMTGNGNLSIGQYEYLKD